MEIYITSRVGIHLPKPATCMHAYTLCKRHISAQPEALIHVDIDRTDGLSTGAGNCKLPCLTTSL